MSENIENIIVSKYCETHNYYNENNLDCFLFEFYKSDLGKSVKIEDRTRIWGSVSIKLSEIFTDDG